MPHLYYWLRKRQTVPRLGNWARTNCIGRMLPKCCRAVLLLYVVIVVVELGEELGKAVVA